MEEKAQKTEEYVMILRQTLHDSRLSWKAKGILSYLLSLPGAWKVDELVQCAKDGRESLRSGLQELMSYGYIMRGKRIRNERGHLKHYKYQVFEVPKMQEKQQSNSCVDFSSIRSPGSNTKGERGKPRKLSCPSQPIDISEFMERKEAMNEKALQEKIEQVVAQMMQEEEKALEGWENIAKFFNMSSRSIQRRRKELQEAGVIFYQWKGTPPARRVFAFPTMLRVWLSRKASKGEML